MVITVLMELTSNHIIVQDQMPIHTTITVIDLLLTVMDMDIMIPIILAGHILLGGIHNLGMTMITLMGTLFMMTTIKLN